MAPLLDILRGKAGPGVQLDLLGAPAGKRAAAPSRMGGFAGVAGTRGGSYLNEGQRDYSASATAYRCIHWIATNAASVDLAVLQGDEPNLDHPTAVLWNRRPNPVLSARLQKELVFARLEVVGELMLYLDRGPTGEGDIAAAWPIYDPVEVVVDRRLGGELQGYVVKVQGGARVPLLPSEVLWLRYPHPFNEWGALAPWKAAMYAAESDAYARAWQRGEFQHGARPSSVVYLGDLDEEAHDKAVAEYEASVAGPENAGRSLLVSGATQAKVERLTLSPAEMSYLESRAANSDEVMLAFGLRPDLFRGQATYENQRAAKVAAWSDTLLPKLEVVASETDRQLLPDLAETAVFDVSGVDALRENADALYARVGGATEVDLLLLDEARAELGFDPLPGNVGQQTLAAYRAQVAAAAAAGSLPTNGRSVLMGARPVIRLLVGARGLQRIVQRPERPEVRRAAARNPRRVQAFYDRHERVGARAVARLAKRQERQVLRDLRKLHPRGLAELYAMLADTDTVRITGSPWTELPVASPLPLGGVALEQGGQRVAADEVFDNAYWREQTVEYLDSFMAGVWEGAGVDAANTLGISLDLFDARVLDSMRTRALILADQVTKTTRAVLDAQLLQAGVEGGESIDQLAARVRAVFTDLSGPRARTIARTETVGGFNATSRIAAQESGVVKGRTWLAANDDRVRDSHQAINGETVNGMAGAYSNGLLHPGDPNGPPRETVNCRCVETYVLED